MDLVSASSRDDFSLSVNGCSRNPSTDVHYKLDMTPRALIGRPSLVGCSSPLGDDLNDLIVAEWQWQPCERPGKGHMRRYSRHTVCVPVWMAL